MKSSYNILTVTLYHTRSRLSIFLQVYLRQNFIFALFLDQVPLHQRFFAIIREALFQTKRLAIFTEHKKYKTNSEFESQKQKTPLKFL